MSSDTSLESNSNTSSPMLHQLSDDEIENVSGGLVGLLMFAATAAYQSYEIWRGYTGQTGPDPFWD